MHFLATLLAAAAVAHAAPNGLEKRQFDLGQLISVAGGLMDSFATKPVKVTNIEGESVTREGSKHKRYWFGPFEVPAGKADMDSEEGHGHSDKKNDWKNSLPKEMRTMLSMANFFTKAMDPNAFLVTRIVTGLCKDCTILRSKILLVDDKGVPLGVDRGIYQHHVNMIPLSMRVKEPSFAQTCPETDKSFYPLGGYSRPMGMDIIGHVYGSQAVENFTLWWTPPNGKVESGYYSDGGPVIMGAEIVNYNTNNQTVFVAVDMEYLDGKHGQQAITMPLSVTGCLSGEFDYFPDGPVTSTRSGKFTVFNDGIIFGMRGHLHDGGESVSLLVNDQKRCESAAGYGGPGSVRIGHDGRKWETISSMTDCMDPIAVKKGDKLELEVNYNLNKHPVRLSKGEKMEGMGLMWFTFVQDNATSTTVASTRASAKQIS